MRIKHLILIIVIAFMFIVPVAAATMDDVTNNAGVVATVGSDGLGNPLSKSEQDTLNVVALWVGKILLVLGTLAAVDPSNRLNILMKKFGFIFTTFGKKIPPDK